jgi:hypothetical protein
MPLIEEKKGFSYPNKRCVRCVNVAPVARNVSRHGRNETATLATLFYIHPGPGIENNKVPLQFFQRSRVLKLGADQESFAPADKVFPFAVFHVSFDDLCRRCSVAVVSIHLSENISYSANKLVRVVFSE